jgi:hypothetical protein
VLGLPLVTGCIKGAVPEVGDTTGRGAPVEVDGLESGCIIGTGGISDNGFFVGLNVSEIGGTFETGDSVEDVGLNAGTPTVTGFSVCKYPVGTMLGVAVLYTGLEVTSTGVGVTN